MVLPYSVFFYNATATTEIYTLSLHDALPIFLRTRRLAMDLELGEDLVSDVIEHGKDLRRARSEEHTSELQSQSNLVCRLLLEKKKLARLRHLVELRPLLGEEGDADADRIHVL